MTWVLVQFAADRLDEVRALDPGPARIIKLADAGIVAGWQVADIDPAELAADWASELGGIVPDPGIRGDMVFDKPDRIWTRQQGRPHQNGHARPQSPPPRDPRGIPALATLIGERRWCCWSWELERKRGEAGKWTKPPRRANGQFARNNDPATWSAFEACWDRVQAGQAEGIGYMLSGLPGSVLAAIDLDDVRDPETGALLPWAAELIEAAGSYCEVTPSGAGLRVLGVAGIAKLHRKIIHPGGGSFELYVDAERYITLSGMVNGHAEFADITPVMRALEAIGPAANGHDPGPEGEAEPILLDGLSLVVVELLTKGMIEGKSVKKRGPAFLRVVKALRSVGHGFERILATLQAYPDGVAGKYAGRLRVELARVWGKLDARPQINVSAPYDAAKLLRERQFTVDGVATLYLNRENWYSWDGRAYVERTEAAIRAVVYSFLDGCVDNTLAPIKPNRYLVANVLDALRAVAHRDIDAPAWLDGEGWPAGEIVACANGLLHLPTGQMLANTPRFFNLNALDCAYREDAPEPVEWLSFLGQLWPDDPESIETLQDIFGYLLTADTRQEKAFLLVGPKRSGKGTIARVLRRLIGPDNTCGPTLASLATTFEMQSLIGKRLAIISDMRLGARTDPAVMAERILSITGEDAIDVSRKFKGAWSGTLQVRFVMLSNELPRLTDASGALVSRFIVLILTTSFYGREDLKLTGRLIGELSGILNWAIAGYRRLQARGFFAQPKSAHESIEKMEDLGSPISAFLRDRCEIGMGGTVGVDAIYDAWEAWSEDQRRKPGTKANFGKQLHAALPGLKMERPRDGDERTRVYVGLGLKPDIEAPTLEGSVKWYDAERGFGFVSLDDGRDAMLPARVVVDMADPAPGQRVKVRVVEGERGVRVTRLVEVIDDQSAF